MSKILNLICHPTPCMFFFNKTVFENCWKASKGMTTKIGTPRMVWPGQSRGILLSLEIQMVLTIITPSHTLCVGIIILNIRGICSREKCVVINTGSSLLFDTFMPRTLSLWPKLLQSIFVNTLWPVHPWNLNQIQTNVWEDGNQFVWDLWYF